MGEPQPAQDTSRGLVSNSRTLSTVSLVAGAGSVCVRDSRPAGVAREALWRGAEALLKRLRQASE